MEKGASLQGSESIKRWQWKKSDLEGSKDMGEKSVRGKGQDEEKMLLKHFWGQVLQQSPVYPSRTRGPDGVIPEEISFTTVAAILTLTPPTSSIETDP